MARRATPSHGRIIAIGDVHGCADELRALIQQLPLERDTLVVFLGDYIDRGPDSRGVVDTVLELEQYCSVVCLLGNHELMLREYLAGTDPRLIARFIYNGGSATLASYADHDGVVVMSEEHRAFFDKLPYHYIEGDFCFVHAGLPAAPEEIDIDKHGEEMVWMRRRAYMPEPNYSKIIVHGHSAVHEVDIKPRRINLDTACVYGRKLTAMDVQTHEMWTVERSSAPQPLYLKDVKDSRRHALRFTGAVPVSVVSPDGPLHFETINYSEIGLLMCPAKKSKATLKVGESVVGTIGTGDTATPFRGVVLRVDDGPRIAVKIVVEQPAV
ncbi:MAG: serine/threonine protein phosphatase [Deltaproteobacteria bacterium]|nr:serine/threonine protein phosphatase [Deltaproteobacteria bacterium]